jgi:hypothetical protein
MTGSKGKMLVTPTGRKSTQYRGEISRIIAEHKGWQEPELLKPTYWMERGVNLEEEARRWFQVEVGKTRTIGFIEDDLGMLGFSPDCLIEDIPVELKCPKPSTHIQWVLAGELPSDHKAQCHFALAITQQPYMWFMSYCPEVEPLLIKVEADNYTATMVSQMGAYETEFKSAYKRITGIDYAAL